MKFAEVYSGAGGLGLGLTRAGFRCVGAWDIDALAVATYRQNVCDSARVADVRRVLLKSGEIDLLAAGLPCESFSTFTGRRFGRKAEKRSNRARAANRMAESASQWSNFVRLLEEAKPTAFVVENVPPFLESRRGRLTIGRARKLGYKVTEQVIDAMQFGIAQTRRRAVLLGSLNEPVVLSDTWEGIPTTVRSAIGDLPENADGENAHVGYSPGPKNRERLRHVPPGGDWHNLPRRLQNPCWREIKRGAVGLFGRLEWDRPAHTIRTTFLKPETGRHIHPMADRALTIREGARLQGFPDSFRFDRGSLDDRARLVGRAVPPPMAHAIGKAIRESL